ncbi:MAG: Uma2 family endonuclease [Anaerolineae bacterium]|nr:Uma2 family endonuclease [Anaerolineales bacterium]MCQ3974949.1 Uma2 family endonuclease [Anaerolineae bacterium]
MSVKTIKQSEPSMRISKQRPLHSGDRLSRAEFERRYQAHPENRKAELVEGVVYVSSPIRYEQHANPHFYIIGWLATYLAATPGVRGGDNATVRLDLENEPQPDALLRLEPALGGQSTITEDDYLEGAPELIVEVAASSASYDLYDKRRAYARNGVREYIVAQTYEQRIDWFVLREGVYEMLQPDEQGLLRSEVFPGLWLQPAALWAGDLATMLAVLQEGLASPEHVAFVEQLKAKMTADR